MDTITDRVYQTSNIPNELLKERPAFPKKVKIEITSRCDLNCFFCAHSYKQIKNGDISPSLLFRLLREARDIGVEEVGLFWLGESLLVKELPDYVAFAKDIGIEYVFLTTNGRLATPEKIRVLFDSGLDSVKFSINAGSRELYRQTCGVDAFDEVIANLRYAYEYRGGKKKPALYASTVFDPENRNDYDSVNALIKDYIDQHYPLHLYGEYTFTAGKEKEMEHHAFIRSEKGRNLKSMLPCWALFTEPHIGFDGFMSACYCDHDKKYYMADLNRLSLLEGWHSDPFVEMRKHHLRKDVKGCPCEDCIAYSH